MTREQGPTRGSGAHAQRIITKGGRQLAPAGNSYAEAVAPYIGLLGFVAGAPDHLKPGSVIDSQNPTGDSTSLMRRVEFHGAPSYRSIGSQNLTSEVRDA